MGMRTLVAACLCLMMAQPAWAVIVFQKDRAEPIRGFLVAEDEIRIVVEEVLPSGESREHILPRTAIDDVIKALDPARLAALSPDNADAYRSYAEDLAVKSEDPEARATALRLYLIAAHLRPDELGRSCLLGMAGLARSPEEERAFRAMAFLLDAEHDPTLLKPPRLVAASPSPSEDDRQGLRTLLRLMRTGRNESARRMMRREEVRSAAARFTHFMNQDDYEALPESGPLPPSLLRKVLMLEMALSPAVVRADPEETSSELGYVPWSQLAARGETAAAIPLNLQVLTEFDPRECVFVDGKWTRPPTE